MRCLTGDAAQAARRKSVAVCEEVLALQQPTSANSEEFTSEETVGLPTSQQLTALKAKLRAPDFPAVVAMELSTLLDKLMEEAVSRDRTGLEQRLAAKLERSMDRQLTGQPSCVHVIDLPYKGPEKVFSSFSLLAGNNRHVDAKPSLIAVFNKEKGVVRAQAVVPKKLATEKFDAK